MKALPSSLRWSRSCHGNTNFSAEAKALRLRLKLKLKMSSLTASRAWLKKRDLDELQNKAAVYSSAMAANLTASVPVAVFPSNMQRSTAIHLGLDANVSSMQ
jgi:hypothetical protein